MLELSRWALEVQQPPVNCGSHPHFGAAQAAWTARKPIIFSQVAGLGGVSVCPDGQQGVRICQEAGRIAAGEVLGCNIGAESLVQSGDLSLSSHAVATPPYPIDLSGAQAIASI